MSDKRTHPLTDVLSSALANSWGKLPDDTKANVKAAVADIIIRLHEGESALEFIAEQPLPEARRADWLIVYNEQAKIELHCTFRGNSDEEVERRILAFLARHGITPGPKWIGLDEKITNRYEAKSAATPSQQPTQAQPVVTGNDEGEYTCKALELLAMPKSESDTTLMWKIKTDKSKYPVPLYNDGGQFNEFFNHNFGISLANFVKDGQPAKFALSNLNALYTKSDKGYPRKITGFSLAS